MNLHDRSPDSERGSVCLLSDKAYNSDDMSYPGWHEPQARLTRYRYRVECMLENLELSGEEGREIARKSEYYVWKDFHLRRKDEEPLSDDVEYWSTLSKSLEKALDEVRSKLPPLPRERDELSQRISDWIPLEWDEVPVGNISHERGFPGEEVPWYRCIDAKDLGFPEDPDLQFIQIIDPNFDSWNIQSSSAAEQVKYSTLGALRRAADGNCSGGQLHPTKSCLSTKRKASTEDLGLMQPGSKRPKSTNTGLPSAQSNTDRGEAGAKKE
ncbi:hypothetical protein E4U41_006764 [Claviceps citrina]|nr:hypothetical protein E4U41_006764 [Claviceps citrina]